MTTWTFQSEAGEAWAYNDSDLEYNSATDPDGIVVNYDSIGNVSSWSFQNKS